jgi:hypothetical protein
VDFISLLLVDKRLLSYLKWYKSEGFDMIIIIVDCLSGYELEQGLRLMNLIDY